MSSCDFLAAVALIFCSHVNYRQVHVLAQRFISRVIRDVVTKRRKDSPMHTIAFNFTTRALAPHHSYSRHLSLRSLLNLFNRFSLCRVRSLLQRTTASWSCYSRFSGHERELVWKSDTLGGFIQRLLVLAIVTVLIRVIQGRS